MPKDPAGERVHARAVGRPVVGEHPLHADAVAGEEGAGTAQEGDRTGRLLVRQHLRVGEAAEVVDRDVHYSQPTVRRRLPSPSCTVWIERRSESFEIRLPAPPWMRPKLLDVDVQELSRPRAFVAPRLIEPDPPELAHPQAAEDPGEGRERHLEQLGYLLGGEAEAAQGDDRLHSLAGRAVGDPAWC